MRSQQENQVAIRETAHEVQAFKQNIFSFPMAQELQQLGDVCKALAACPFYQKLGYGGIMAIFLTAKELNLPPMVCLNGGMYTFSGQVTLSAQLMHMMIINAGHRVKIIEMTTEKCKLNFIRSNGDHNTYEFTVEEAQKAGYLGKTNWKTHLKDMLYARALSGGARKYFPDAIMGAYVQGEMGPEDELIKPVLPDNLEFEEEKCRVISFEDLSGLLSILNRFDDKFKNSFHELIEKRYGTTLPELPYEHLQKVLKLLDDRWQKELEKKQNEVLEREAQTLVLQEVNTSRSIEVETEEGEEE
jgi:hypothetical protein